MSNLGVKVFMTWREVWRRVAVGVVEMRVGVVVYVVSMVVLIGLKIFWLLEACSLDRYIGGCCVDLVVVSRSLFSAFVVSVGVASGSRTAG